MKDFPAVFPKRGVPPPHCLSGYCQLIEDEEHLRGFSPIFLCSLISGGVAFWPALLAVNRSLLKAGQFQLYGLPVVNQTPICDQGISPNLSLEHVSPASRFSTATA